MSRLFKTIRRRFRCVSRIDDEAGVNGAIEMDDFSERYRQLRASGIDRDLALGVLRREGARFLLCIKAVVDVDELSLGDAKSIVHESRAWSDDREGRESFWDEVIRELNSEFPCTDK